MRKHGFFFYYFRLLTNTFCKFEIFISLWFLEPWISGKIGRLIQPIIDSDPNEGADWLNFREEEPITDISVESFDWLVSRDARKSQVLGSKVAGWRIYREVNQPAMF